MLRTFLILGLFAGAASHAAPIELMVEDAASPWSNSDGSGYANELVLAAYDAVRTDIKLVVVPYARCKTYVMNGTVAGCFSMSDELELQGKVHFSDAPLFQAYPRFYQNSAYPVAARSVGELVPGTRIGIVNGYEYPQEVMLLAKKGVILEQTRSESLNLKKLAAGRINLALTMMDDIKNDEAVLREAQVSGVAFAFQATPQGSFLGFSTVHPDGERARMLFNKGYKIILENGLKRAIDRKWKLPPTPGAR